MQLNEEQRRLMPDNRQKRNIAIIEDTLKIIDNGSYSIGGNTYNLTFSKDEYSKAFFFDTLAIKKLRDNPVFKGTAVGKPCKYRVFNQDSFTSAQDLDSIKTDSMPVLVLNLADPIHPGAMVYKGNSSQEEDLCRRSTLLASLNSAEGEKFYKFHKAHRSFLASDCMILSPNVEIFRNYDGSLMEKTINVAVLTCSAPMASSGIFDSSKYGLNNDIILQRMMGMLCLAASYGYMNLLLGAWGCGTYRNHPDDIAKMFQKAFSSISCDGLREDKLFENVIFAVHDKTIKQENYKAFCNYFKNLEAGGLRRSGITHRKFK